MDAIALLQQQHRELERLFARAKRSDDPGAVIDRIADALALHAALEERRFYPATRSLRSADRLREAVEDHLAMKQLVADLMSCEPGDAAVEAGLNRLAEQVAQHVEQEERELFPQVALSLSPDELEELGLALQDLADELLVPAPATRAEGAPLD
ncbi:MAG TPA: hemerythrin domain-containing protein [Myxococcales bacterium]|nr:hemerythrin domain-containing protein [Myxococcales bacterium]